MNYEITKGGGDYYVWFGGGGDYVLDFRFKNGGGLYLAAMVPSLNHRVNPS